MGRCGSSTMENHFSRFNVTVEPHYRTTMKPFLFRLSKKIALMASCLCFIPVFVLVHEQLYLLETHLFQLARAKEINHLTPQSGALAVFKEIGLLWVKRAWDLHGCF